MPGPHDKFPLFDGRTPKESPQPADTRRSPTGPPAAVQHPAPGHAAPRPQAAPRPRRRPASRQQQPGRRQAIINNYDVHITSGMTDNVVRLTPEQYQTLFQYWWLGKQDTVIRGTFANSQVWICLRGSEGGELSITQADTTRARGQYSVISSSELQTELLDAMEKSGE